MRYVTPRIDSVGMKDVLAKLGPARAMLYTPGAGDVGGTSGSTVSGSTGNSFGTKS